MSAADSDALRRRAAAARAAAPPARTPPEERGQRLGTIPKREGEEVRITWDEYEGRAFLSVRLWTRGAEGGWWPTKSGVTVSPRHLPVLAEAIAAALDLADQAAAHRFESAEGRPTPAPRPAPPTPRPALPTRPRRDLDDDPDDGPPWGPRGEP